MYYEWGHDTKGSHTKMSMEKEFETEYSSHALAEVVGGENRNDCILVTRSRIGK